MSCHGHSTCPQIPVAEQAHQWLAARPAAELPQDRRRSRTGGADADAAVKPVKVVGRADRGAVVEVVAAESGEEFEVVIVEIAP